MKKNLHLLLALLFANLISSQNLPNDCVNAITVCGNGTFSSNANGPGSKQEVAGCNSSQEHNSLWIKINVVQSGTLGFDLIPNDSNLATDFDFWVYGPNKTCSNLGSPIRCCIANPIQAELANNHTGMDGSTVATAAWSGTGGNNLAYVKWLNVIAGESYYIVVDRPYTTPSGDTGFLINWTGTATQGSGAFPTCPVANKVSDYLMCSSANTNQSVFNLNTAKSQINPDLVNNTVNFYSSLANAVDGISTLPDFYTNTSNPQKIYAKVVSNLGGGSVITDFNLKVFPLPTAAISLSKYVVCSGENFTVTFTGTPEATIDYKVNGGATQSVLLDKNGIFLLSQAVTVNTTYDLVMAKNINGNNQVICQQSINDSITVTYCSNLAVEKPKIMDLNVRVYPNPSNSAFVIDLNTLNQESVKIKVYDMLGRLVEQTSGTPNELADNRIGQNFVPGIYNMVLTQGQVAKSIRIIKE